MIATLAEHGCVTCDFRPLDYEGPQQRLDIAMGSKISSYKQSPHGYLAITYQLKKRWCKGKQSLDGLLDSCQKPWYHPISAHFSYTSGPCVFIYDSMSRDLYFMEYRAIPG